MRTDEQRARTRESTKRWRAANPEHAKQLGRVYYQQRREKILARQKQRRIDHPELFRERAKRQYQQRKDTQPSPYHGLSRIEVHRRLKAQGGCCGICKTTVPGGRGWNGDHDHATGAFRGVLCRSCNMGIGALGDTVAGVRAALEYLEKHEQLQRLL